MSTRRRSAFRTTPSNKGLKVEMTVPPKVTDFFKTVWSKVWDASCPFASLFLWMMVAMALYYLFLMPSVSVKIEDNNVKAVKVTRTLRGWLFLTTLLGGFIGFNIIRQGCEKAGSQWSVIWFVSAFALTWIITRLVLASVEKISLSDASTLMQKLD